MVALLTQVWAPLLPRVAQVQVLEALARAQPAFMAGAVEAALDMPSIIAAAARASTTTVTTMVITGMADAVICTAAR